MQRKELIDQKLQPIINLMVRLIIQAWATGETFPTPDVHYWDGSVGMSFNTTFGADQQNSLFFGAAFHHLNRPKNSFYQNAQTELDPKYVFSGGGKN